jgi:acetyl esterase/lipase
MDLLKRLDPEIATIFPDLPVLDLTDIPAARSALAEFLAATAATTEHSPNVTYRDHMAPGLAGAVPGPRVRLYRPAEQSGALPCLYWIHGGGHVRGQIEQDDFALEHIVEAVGCVVASVDWRRAPEHPFPAELDDCYSGLTWIHDNATTLAIDPNRIAVAGASSGGGSAAGLALIARDRGHPALCFQLLIEPMLDDRNVTPSSYAILEPRVWNRQSNLIAWRCYLDDASATDEVSPYAAPARSKDLTCLPPTFISVGDLDLFFDEAVEYAQRLQRAEVPVELHVYPGAIHGFDSLATASRVAQRSTRDRDEALQRAFQG